MNKEIKYELNILSNTIIDDTTYKPTIKRRKLLLDYITNLQQENERLKAIWKDTNVIIKDDKTLVMNTNAYDCLEDYKSRCEKAIGYIRELQTNAPEERALNKLLEILEGGKNE